MPQKKTVKKATKQVVQPVAPVVKVEPSVKTPADKIWDEIKNLPIAMFALADQRVHMYVKPVVVEPSRLFLIASVGSVLPSLEMVVAPKYAVEKIDRFLVVSLVTNFFQK